MPERIPTNAELDAMQATSAALDATHARLEENIAEVGNYMLSDGALWDVYNEAIEAYKDMATSEFDSLLASIREARALVEALSNAVTTYWEWRGAMDDGFPWPDVLPYPPEEYHTQLLRVRAAMARWQEKREVP